MNSKEEADALRLAYSKVTFGWLEIGQLLAEYSEAVPKGKLIKSLDRIGEGLEILLRMWRRIPVIRTCKGDMKEEFEAAPKMQLEIEQFTEEQMNDIAARVGEDLIEHYWEAIRKEVEEELNRR